MLSGFGGCNATLYAASVEKPLEEGCESKEEALRSTPKVMPYRVYINPEGAWLNGKTILSNNEQEGKNLLTTLYKQMIGDYPKYYKMDGLCRLGFVASELLLQAEKAVSEGDEKLDSKRAIMLFNHTSSIASDKRYLASIADKDNYFPSPSIFVYTLPNIVTGEIAIRNGYHGETSFYILTQRDEQQMQDIIETAFIDKQTKSLLTGWLDYKDSEHFEADLYIVSSN